MIWTHHLPDVSAWRPWKNGGGRTLELAVDPPSATLESGFRWRVSRAEVATSGPFSPFPGLDRTLVLLEGDGCLLDFGSRGRVLLERPLDPVCFSGDWLVQATLIGGPCLDFNLIVDPTRCRADLQVLHLERPCSLSLASSLLIFLAGGVLSVPALDVTLGRHHTLRVEGASAPLETIPGYGGAVLIVVRID